MSSTYYHYNPQTLGEQAAPLRAGDVEGGQIINKDRDKKDGDRDANEEVAERQRRGRDTCAFLICLFVIIFLLGKTGLLATDWSRRFDRRYGDHVDKIIDQKLAAMKSDINRNSQYLEDMKMN